MFQLTHEFKHTDSIREWYNYLKGNGTPCGIAQVYNMFSVWRGGKFRKTVAGFKGESTLEVEDAPRGKLKESCHGFDEEWDRERGK